MTGGGCFLCDLVRGRWPHPEDILHRDRLAVTVLARPGIAPGHVLVAPVRHVEAVLADFPLPEYLDLQRRVHEVGTAVQAVRPGAGLSVLSRPGEPGGHVRWHVVPSPPHFPGPVLELVPLAGSEDADRVALTTELRARLAR